MDATELVEAVERPESLRAIPGVTGPARGVVPLARWLYNTLNYVAYVFSQLLVEGGGEVIDLICQEIYSLCGSVSMHLAFPLPIARLDGELDRLAVDESLDVRVRHFRMEGYVE